jgi:dihydropyrimidinase
MICIKNGKLITASETYVADILIEDEKIVSITNDVDRQFSGQGYEVIDGSGKLILPGGVDAHTHFDLPMFGTVSSDDHYTGHKAAAFGGTTTVIDFVPLEDDPGGRNKNSILKNSVEIWQEKSAKAAIDYSFHMNLTRYDAAIEFEIPDLVEMGITSLKVFTAYNNRLRLDDGSIFRALRIAKENGMLVMVHCENGDVIETLISEAQLANHLTPEWHARTRPAWGAVDATLRMASLAAQADAAIYIVHMNVAGEVDMLKYAREHGVKVMGETCPQYLFFAADLLRGADGAKWVCSPPVRSAADNIRLWEGVADGTLQTIATDHCPFFFDGRKPIDYEGQKIAIPGKELGAGDFTRIPNGLPGVGDRLPILWTYGVGAGKMSANQFVALNCTNPAKIFGLYPQKGALLPGSDADLVIWDPSKKVKYGVAHAQHRTDHNLYEGWELTGYPEKVFLRGQVIVDNGKWLGRSGYGKFIKRSSKDLL